MTRWMGVIQVEEEEEEQDIITQQQVREGLVL
jgi:hypothetical protein